MKRERKDHSMFAQISSLILSLYSLSPIHLFTFLNVSLYIYFSLCITLPYLSMSLTLSIRLSYYLYLHFYPHVSLSRVFVFHSIHLSTHLVFQLSNQLFIYIFPFLPIHLSKLSTHLSAFLVFKNTYPVVYLSAY